MDDYVVDHEMPLHLMQRKSQWKTQKVQNEALKFQFKHLRIKRYSTLSVPAVVR